MSDKPPVDPEPEEGDTVIEMIDGVPHISTHTRKKETIPKGIQGGTRQNRLAAAKKDPAYYAPKSGEDK